MGRNVACGLAESEVMNEETPMRSFYEHLLVSLQVWFIGDFNLKQHFGV